MDGNLFNSSPQTNLGDLRSGRRRRRGNTNHNNLNGGEAHGPNRDNAEVGTQVTENSPWDLQMDPNIRATMRYPNDENRTDGPLRNSQLLPYLPENQPVPEVIIAYHREPIGVGAHVPRGGMRLPFNSTMMHSEIEASRAARSSSTDLLNGEARTNGIQPGTNNSVLELDDLPLDISAASGGGLMDRAYNAREVVNSNRSHRRMTRLYNGHDLDNNYTIHEDSTADPDRGRLNPVFAPHTPREAGAHVVGQRRRVAEANAQIERAGRKMTDAFETAPAMVNGEEDSSASEQDSVDAEIEVRGRFAALPAHGQVEIDGRMAVEEYGADASPPGAPRMATRQLSGRSASGNLPDAHGNRVIPPPMEDPVFVFVDNRQADGHQSTEPAAGVQIEGAASNDQDVAMTDSVEEENSPSAGDVPGRDPEFEPVGRHWSLDFAEADPEDDPYRPNPFTWRHESERLGGLSASHPDLDDTIGVINGVNDAAAWAHMEEIHMIRVSDAAEMLADNGQPVHMDDVFTISNLTSANDTAVAGHLSAGQVRRTNVPGSWWAVDLNGQES